MPLNSPQKFSTDLTRPGAIAETPMTQLTLSERVKCVVRELSRLIGERVTAQTALTQAYRTEQQNAEAEFAEHHAQLDARLRHDLAAAEGELKTSRQRLTSRHKTDHETVETECQLTVEKINRELDRIEKKTKHALNEARWLARTVYEAKRKELTEKLTVTRTELQAEHRGAQILQQEGVDWLQRNKLSTVAEEVLAEFPTAVAVAGEGADAANGATGEGQAPEAAPEPPSAHPGPPREWLAESLATAITHLQELAALRVPAYTQGSGLLSVFFGAAIVAAPLMCGLGWLVNLKPLFWGVLSGIATLLLGIGISAWLKAIAWRHSSEIFRPLCQAVKEAKQACQQCLNDAIAESKREQEKCVRQRDADAGRADETHNPILATCARRRQTEPQALVAAADERMIALQSELDSALKLAVTRHAVQTVEARQNHQRDLEELRSNNEKQVRELVDRLERKQSDEQSAWQNAYAAAKAEVASIRQQVDRDCPSWETLLLGQWQPPDTMPQAIRFGWLSLDLRSKLTGSGPGGGVVGADDGVFSLPAALDFPAATSVFIKTQDTGRRRAIELLQVMMLRLATSVPPGKVRFTIVDPVGLGQNFAAFMHLADFDEALVGHRIWTEPQQIEQRLADLTEHMETVIQKYLRDEFPTIESYNLQAGEIAEPFRVLVVANFPAGFNEASARRLLSVAASGRRCGVHVMLSLDSRLPAIPGIRLADLKAHATVFSATPDRITWEDPALGELPLVIDSSPTDQSKQLLKAVGAAAVSAKRVEVPFEAIAPPVEEYWTGDSRRGIDVPLGRAGATRLAHLKLGLGTSQHVLIAGKTGSGKSTLLHALITNAALRYAPDELELYLIDFKKGVEFKTYVTHKLPHARVVAIESEREFGLSVMQRLDHLMRERGETFREAGVQDIGGYRDQGHQLPRILFIVDEFQEFFVQDDKVAQEASLLLDRLVRQGRAFGIHVHLGSQTLGGAYSLARSTLGQMAIRIALQCSENDAHLILSEDNSAARLLSRPGEAIYNDAGGLVEGNHPFQVVWLPDERREIFLGRVKELLAARPQLNVAPQIVFEGTQPADLERNAGIAEMLAGAASGAGASAARAWLGEPLAIDKATSADFQQRGGANLLLLGQNDDAVAGMMVSTILSLAAQLPAPDPATGPQFQILLGGALEASYGALLRKLSTYLPGRVSVAESVDAPAVVAELAADVARRQTAVPGEQPRYLLVFDIARLRVLRKQEDDFSFSRSSEPAAPKPDRQFAEILREGPSVGVHTLVWCDTLTNFNRVLDRQSLKEFDTRVLLQMSATDSSLLIDSPSAGQLGRHRALLHREDEGRLEKFRPYSVPSEQWLAQVCQQLQARGGAKSKNGAADNPTITIQPESCP
jgi:S-DNA-T family DNA segregation ATPase FtsK/SpoIIIE